VRGRWKIEVKREYLTMDGWRRRRREWQGDVAWKRVDEKQTKRHFKAEDFCLPSRGTRSVSRSLDI
jgi:hypothetical protein